MKRFCLTFCFGFSCAVALACYLGGERCTQLALKLSAAERSYDFIATPHEAIAAVAPPTAPTLLAVKRVKR